ncbi:MAG: TlpA disulfide reductase family protein [Formosimonas sp.]
MMAIRLRWIAAAALVAVVATTAYKNLTRSAGEMAAVQLTTIEQKPIAFADWQKAGKVTVVNFWATSCSTCKKEMPKLVEIYKTYNPQGLEYVGIAMQYDDPAYIKNYVAAQQLPFNIAWDKDGRLAEQFGMILGTPTTFIIGKNGNIVKKYVGEPKWDEFDAALKAALAA